MDTYKQELFTVRASWIHANRTARGGFRRNQLKALGVPWPPVAGWKERAEGMLITLSARRTFEAFAGVQPRARMKLTRRSKRNRKQQAHPI